MLGLRHTTIAVIFLFGASAVADEKTDFFESKIRPVLVENCYGCHSAKAQQDGKLKGELLLDVSHKSKDTPSTMFVKMRMANAYIFAKIVR